MTEVHTSSSFNLIDVPVGARSCRECSLSVGVSSGLMPSHLSTVLLRDLDGRGPCALVFGIGSHVC